MEHVRRDLIAWYRAHRRELPWRRRSDAYSIWISEVMLQQTRVDTVIPYYERFLGAWPNVAALAAADPEAVRAAWSGLGYYRRAQLMLAAAHQVVAEHGGELPRSVDALRTLPGFGPYTAGAVASIAYDARVPAVDGNVIRVLARLACVEGDTTKGAPRQAVDRLAEQLAADDGDGSAGDWTQALMELGATVCTPRAPRCAACPVAGVCSARRNKRVDAIPPPRRRPARPCVALSTAVLTDVEGTRVWLAQRPRDGLFAELWTPPLWDGALEEAAVRQRLRDSGTALAPKTRPSQAGELTHVLTHRELVVSVWHATVSSSRDLRAVPLDGLDAVGLPSIAAKILRTGLPRGVRSRAPLPGRRTRARAQLSLIEE